MCIVWRWFAHFTDPMSIFLWHVQYRRAANNLFDCTVKHFIWHSMQWSLFLFILVGKWIISPRPLQFFSFSLVDQLYLRSLHLTWTLAAYKTLCVKSLVAQSAAVGEPECTFVPVLPLSAQFLTFLMFLGQSHLFTCQLYEHHFIRENTSWYDVSSLIYIIYSDSTLFMLSVY